MVSREDTKIPKKSAAALEKRFVGVDPKSQNQDRNKILLGSTSKYPSPPPGPPPNLAFAKNANTRKRGGEDARVDNNSDPIHRGLCFQLSKKIMLIRGGFKVKHATDDKHGVCHRSLYGVFRKVNTGCYVLHVDMINIMLQYHIRSI